MAEKEKEPGALSDMDNELAITDDEFEDDDVDDIEPKLIYERVENEVKKIIEKDAVSSVCVHDRFIVIGTHWGKIFLLDQLGNQVHRELILHNTSVNQISVDSKGEFVASCSDDRVQIHGLHYPDNNYLMTFDRPIRAVAIDPQFGTRSSSRRFFTGGDSVKLHEKSFLLGYKSTALLSGDGQVRNIKWHGQFVAWASDLNVRIYDADEKSIITVIRRDHDARLRPEIYRCNLFWRDNRTLLVGWGDSVKVCVIKDKIPPPLSPDLPNKYVEIISMFTANYCISGISSIDSNNIVILGMNKKEALETTGARPQLLVLETHPSDYIELSSDMLSPRGFAAYQCHDYHLGALAEDGFYFIVCPKDVILAKPREEDDHIAWLLERQKFTEALDAIRRSRTLRRFTLLGVGRQYLDHLLHERKQSAYEEAAALCSTIMGSDRKNWQDAVHRFAEHKQFRTLAKYLPTGPDVLLDEKTYESVLVSFIHEDTKGFLELIRRWPTSLYRSPVIVRSVMDVDQYQADDCLNRALAELYTNEGNHEKALEIYLQIGDTDRVFSLIQRFDLFSTLRERLAFLMQLNAEEASRMLIDNHDKIPMDHVIAKLKSKPNLLWVYLDKVVQRDPEQCSQHHDLLVELYASNAPEKLLPFLRSSNSFSLENALRICRSKNLVSEMVFLLGRMGNTQEALHYITDSLNDIDRAIEFCKEHGDIDLWDNLIDLSMKKPHFIRVLIENIGTHIPDPIALVHKIPEGLEIDGLKSALCTILQDYNLQIALEERCRRILVSDNYNILEKLHHQQKRAIAVTVDTACRACSRNIFSNGMRYLSDIVVFNCKHVFHEECLPATTGERIVCTLCLAGKQQQQLFASGTKQPRAT